MASLSHGFHNTGRIVEFRPDVKLASCAMPDCDQTVYSQNLCSEHYQWQLEARKGGRRERDLQEP